MGDEGDLWQAQGCLKQSRVGQCMRDEPRSMHCLWTGEAPEFHMVGLGATTSLKGAQGGRVP